MESEDAALPCYVIKSHSNRVYVGAFLDLLCSIVGFIAFSYSLAVVMDNIYERKAEVWMIFCLAALLSFIVRIPAAILILIGNKTENLRLLFSFGVQCQRVLVVINLILAIMPLRLVLDNVVALLQTFIAFSLLSVLLFFLVSKRIFEIIPTESGADATALSQQT